MVAAVSHGAIAETVLRQAHEQALAAEAPLVVCQVLPPAALNHADVRGEAYRVLVAQVERVTQRTRAEYTVVHPTGDAASGISRLAEQIDASLTVVGPGLTAVLVVRNGGCPVLVAREGPEGCVLGATDFTDPNFPALTQAAIEARRREKPLCFFHALRPVENLLRLLPNVVAPHGVLPLTEEEQTQAVEDVRQQLGTYARELHTPAEALATMGTPASEITRAARTLGAEVLVIATRGRAGLLRFLRGSVAETTILSAPCSVLVVRKAW